ncbi:hypothetical protein [Arthrobacter sp. USHLN218]|uniref:hypothetical protein n=1 Tax=Arthrobacter sp. USHLN218 TaxID=3081232 RepID=UPI003016150D
MQRATLRYVLIGLAVVLGMGLAGFAVASTFREPGSSDLGPSIVFTPSPAASEPDKGAEPEPGPKEPSAPPKRAPDKTAAPSPAAPVPVPVQPAPPVEYDDDDDDASEPDEDDDGIDD